ncbi:MAG: hypothetical protein KAH03_02145, partial [Cocleimonas sp.]|nr:hypothetical protein [Cocleimonas sp.]
LKNKVNRGNSSPQLKTEGFSCHHFYKLKHKGAGLGLAISQRLLALHHIPLDVSSEVGKGTRFSFCLQKV